MSDLGETRYAKTPDGSRIGYQITGRGDIDILEISAPGPSLSIDSTAELPEWLHYEERLGSFSRLIRYDMRGVGLSDPFGPEAAPTVEQQADDALAVLDSASSEQAAVVATTPGGYTAMLLAASHPERIRALVLIHAVARVMWAPDYPFGVREDAWESVKDDFFDPDAPSSIDEVALLAPSRAGDEAFRSWWARAGRRGASPATARARFATLARMDMRQVLPTISVPTLVLQRRDNAFVVPDHGRYLAEHIADARYVELDGADHIPWLGDADALLGEVEEFLTGTRQGAEPDRVLATVLFSDIVESTRIAAEHGDAAWRGLLNRHHDSAATEVRRFRGRVIKTTGDGIVATFDGPGRAIKCAEALRTEMQRLGLDIRVGIHTGEIELIGDDVAGIAVHVAARVMSHAGAGDVLVSSSVPPLVIGSGIDFNDRGEHELRGIPGQWRLFGVR